MTRFVLDCSVAMAWCFEDEADSYSEAVLDLLPNGEARVPFIWTLEITNVLLVAERKGRITEAKSARFLSLLNELPIYVEQGEEERVLSIGLPLARETGVSSYDAAYLDLALRLGLPLATRDRKMTQAGLKCGVKPLKA